jgi:hypothetical protein
MIELVEPKPKIHSDIGKTVMVFDRYHFAVPLKGRIQDVASKDGAYKVSFYNKQHGYPNYLQFNHTYFFAQQCQIVKEEPKGIWIGDMEDGDVAVIVDHPEINYLDRIIQRHDHRFITVGTPRFTWSSIFTPSSNRDNFRVRLLEKGETLVVV